MASLDQFKFYKSVIDGEEQLVSNDYHHHFPLMI